MNNIIKKFKNRTKGEQLFTFHGPFSLLFFGIPWTDEKESLAESTVPWLFINKGRDTQVIVSEDAYRGHAKEVFKKYLNGGIRTEYLQSIFDRSFDEIKDLYDRVFSNDIKNLSNESLEEIMKSVADSLCHLIARTLYVETFDRQIADDSVPPLQKKALDAVWSRSIIPAFESFDIRRKRQTNEIIKQYGINNVGAREAIFIYIDYFSPKTLDQIKELLIIFDKDNKKIIPVYDENEEKFKYETWANSLSHDEQKIAVYVQFVMKLRDLRKDPIAWAHSLIAEIATEMLIRAEISPQIAYAISPLEYKNGIEWLRVNKDRLLGRINGVVASINDMGKIEVECVDHKLLKIDLLELLPSADSVVEVKGQPASKGHHVGIVRIVIDPDGNQAKDFQEGDVLVTSMTRPEFVPLMKRAGAVITNEGGITCHAAIISRELKIPCIIGTKIATQVLKDGDLVEVDANNGVVRIVENG